MAHTSQKVTLKGRDEIEIQIDLDNGLIKSVKLSAIGCMDLLKLVAEWRGKLKGSLDTVSIPEGKDHASVLLRELLLKVRGEWNYPYTDEEICHCRCVPTIEVDSSIVAGSHTVERVGRETSAGTACGTCRGDIMKVIEYRLETSVPANSALRKTS